jgi:hypothetical protein
LCLLLGATAAYFFMKSATEPAEEIAEQAPRPEEAAPRPSQWCSLPTPWNGFRLNTPWPTRFAF